MLLLLLYHSRNVWRVDGGGCSVGLCRFCAVSAPVLKFDCIGLELKFVILCLVVKCERQGTSISNCRKGGLWILGRYYTVLS